MSQSDKLLSIRNLTVRFGEATNSSVKGMNLDLHSGETVALIGESGSGKSLTALSILQLLPYPYAKHGDESSIEFEGQELINCSDSHIRSLRGNKISMIFQEPMTSLNPLHPIGKQVAESIMLHQKIIAKDELKKKTIELLKRVEIRDPENRLDALPHELSGGEKQRVMIAIALANEPKILLADEPTTALDVSVQFEILSLLKRIQKEEGLCVLLITHDFSVVQKAADRILVMQNGAVVESGDTDNICNNPQHPYTKLLLDSIPQPRSYVKLEDRKNCLVAESIVIQVPVKNSKFFSLRKDKKTIVESASFKLKEGSTLGVIGESGSGKTSLSLAVLQLMNYSGSVYLNDKKVGSTPKDKLNFRRYVQVVFQDPFGSLSPRMRIVDIIAEGLKIHYPNTTAKERDQQVQDILAEVSLDPKTRFRFPHEFSGGQRQRIAISRALILKPKVLFLDEPTSALDRTVQLQVLKLLESLQNKYNLAYVFISHDMQVVRSVSDDVMIMQKGKIVEYGQAQKIFASPEQPYTKQLFKQAYF